MENSGLDPLRLARLVCIPGQTTACGGLACILGRATARASTCSPLLQYSLDNTQHERGDFTTPCGHEGVASPLAANSHRPGPHRLFRSTLLARHAFAGSASIRAAAYQQQRRASGVCVGRRCALDGCSSRRCDLTPVLDPSARPCRPTRSPDAAFSPDAFGRRFSADAFRPTLSPDAFRRHSRPTLSPDAFRLRRSRTNRWTSARRVSARRVSMCRANASGESVTTPNTGGDAIPSWLRVSGR